MLTILFSYLHNLNHILCIICINIFNSNDVRLLIFFTRTKQKKVAEIKKSYDYPMKSCRKALKEDME